MDNFDMEEKYTIEQIIDAIVQCDSEIVYALQHKDRKILTEVLTDTLKEYLPEKGGIKE